MLISLNGTNDNGAFVDAISEHDADIAALSSLLTTSMPSMKKIVAELKEQAIGVKTMVGGAPTSIEFAKRIGSYGYGKNGPEAVEVARSLMEI